jgi:hypothetical protein
MLRKLIYTTLATLAILVGIIAVGLQTETVQKWIDIEFKIQVRDHTGWNITYNHFTWEFPFRFTLTDITLHSPSGKKIKIERVSGSMNPIAALRKYVLIHDLDILYQDWNVVGTVRGNPSSNSFAATLTATSTTDPTFLLSVKTKGKEFAGTLDLDGQWHDFEGQLKGKILWTGEQFQYTELSGNLNHYAVSGNLLVDKELRVDGTEIGLTHPEGNGSVVLSGTYQDLKAEFDLTIPEYKLLADLHMHGDLSRKHEKVDTQFNASFALDDERYYTDTHLTWSPDSPLKFRTNGRDKDGMTFDADFSIGSDETYKLDVTFERGRYFNKADLQALLPKNADHWDYSLLVNGPFFKADLEGNAKIDSLAQSVEVTDLKLNWDNFQFDLEDPFSFTRTPDQLTLSPLFGQIEKGTVYMSFDYTGDNIHIAARLVDLPVRLLPTLNEGLPSEATFNGNFFIFGPVNHLGGQAQIELPEIKLTHNMVSNIPTLEGKINANLYDDKLDVTGNFSGISTTPISLDASIPMVLSLDPLLVDINLEKPFTTKVSYDGPVGPITELITSETAPLKGDLSLKLELEGTLNNPKVAGKGTFKNGSYESIDTGVIYQNISAVFEARSDHIAITQISATDGENGTITGSGSLYTSIEKRFPFEFNLALDALRLVRIDWIRSTGTGSINFSGDFNHAKLSGNIAADSLNVTIPERRSSNIKVVPITYINQSKDEPPPTIITTTPIDWPIELDVSLESKRAVVSGDQFTTNWRGKATLNGTIQDPRLEGKVRIIDGSYLFNGHPFDITQGSIIFNGDPLSDTNLYVVAEQDIGDITAEVVLKGALDNLELALRSKPAMSQREVLSWILFGRGISDISPIENQELTKSISELHKNGGKKDALTRFRQQIGIDRIDITRDITGETNEMSIEVGKYISKGVLVSVNRNISNDANRIGIEARLSRNFKVEAKVGDNAEGHLFLKWKRDY